MVELTESACRTETSFLHRMDPRFKILFLALLSMSNAKAGPWGLILLFVLQFSVLSASRVRIKGFLAELRYFSLFLFFVFAARAFATPGDRIFQQGFLSFAFPISEQGAVVGATVAFRLFLVVMLGFLFIQTTPPSKVRAAVGWYLKSVPVVPEKRVAAMLSLLVRFLPLIVQQAKETADAQRARCADNRKNPVRRLVPLATAVLRRTFLRADELVLAMEARGYDENRAMPRLRSNKSDWIALAFILPISCLPVIFPQMSKFFI